MRSLNPPSLSAKKTPCLRGFPWIGVLPHYYWHGPIGLYTRAWRRHGDLFRMQLGPYSAVMVVHPRAVQEVLVTRRENFIKGHTYDQLRMLTGDGLVTLEGPTWRKHRRMAQPAFHKDSVRDLVERFVAVTRDGLADLRRRVPSGGVIEAHHEMTRLTLDVVGETLFGRRLGPNAGASAQAFTEAFEVLARHSELPFAIPRWLPTPGNRRLARSLRTLDELVYSIIGLAQARADETRSSLLSLLVEARDADTGERLSAAELRDEIITLVMAGHETTALLLTWGFTLLAREPRVIERMRAEVSAVLGDREPRADDLPRLTYLRQVIDEILRLRPPAWVLGRDVVDDCVLSGHRVYAGEIVLAVPYLTHRHHEFWQDPECFDPDRFCPEQVRTRPNFAYYPFSAGPRSCIGNLFSIAEAQVILAMLLQSADFSLVSPEPIPLRPIMTLRPGAPVPIRLYWRDLPDSRRATRDRAAGAH